MWCLDILRGAWGLHKKKETREWTTPLNPTGYLCKRLAAHGCIALRAITLPWWANPLLNRGFHRESHLCWNAPAVTSLAAVFSVFSENENSWRTSATGLDLISCIKTDLRGHRVQLMNFLLLLFGRREQQTTFPVEKSGEKYCLQRGIEGPSLPPTDSFLGRDTFWLPSKISILAEVWIYIPLHESSLISLIWIPKPITRIKG